MAELGNPPFLPSHPEKPYTKPTVSDSDRGKSYVPTHPDLFRVEFSSGPSDYGERKTNGDGVPDVHRRNGGEDTFSSRLVAVRDFPPNSTVTPLTNLSTGAKAYSSVQYGPGAHDNFELNSDLLFLNHSCDPSACLVLPPGRPDLWEVRTAARGIKRGEEITFFYPSTEWDMAQGFECSCRATNCLGEIKGAKNLSLAALKKRGFNNEHIWTLKQGLTANGT